MAQPCVGPFSKKFTGVSKSDAAYNVKATSNNDIIVTGLVYDDITTVNSVKGTITKFDSSGNFIKGKKIVFPEGTNGINDNEKLKDGNFLLVDNLIVVNRNSDPDKIVLLLKYNDNLNSIWSKSYKFPFRYATGFDIIEAADRSIYLHFGFSLVTGIGYPDYWAIAKFDQDGNFLWCKTYKPLNSFVINIGKMIESSDYLYFSGQYSINDFSTYLFKVEKNTGNLIWTKSFKTPGKQTNLGQSLKAVGNNIVLAGYNRINYSNNRAVLLSVNEDGNVKKCKSYSSGDNTVSISAMEASIDKIIVAGSISKQGSANTYFATFDHNLNYYNGLSYIAKEYARDITIAKNGSIVETGTVYYNSSNADMFVRKRLADGQLGGCNQAPVTVDEITEAVDVNNVPIQTGNLILPPVNLVYSLADYSLTVKETTCTFISDCSAIKLSGSTSICNMSNTYIYKTSKNSNCTQTVNWIYDTASVQRISSTDSTITVRFLKAGSTKIKATLFTGCPSPLIDSISVLINSRNIIINLGNDKTLCKDSVLKLTPGNSFVSYKWQDGNTDSVIIVSNPGLYYVTVTDSCNNTFSDTINIFADVPTDFNLADDIIKCNQDTVKLSIASGFTNYQWSPTNNISSTTGPSVSVYPNVDTRYFIKATKPNGCLATDSIYIHAYYSAPINLGNDTSFCANDSILLSGGNGFSEYSWNTGSSTPAITIKTAGTYSVTAKASNGCYSKDTLVVQKVYALPKVDLGADFNLCTNDEKRLDAGNFKSYIWQNGTTNQYFTANNKELYWVKVTDNNNCSSSDSVEVKALLPLPSNFLKDVDSICQYDKLQLQAQGNYIKYSWSTGSGQQSINIDKPGAYTLTVTDASGCNGIDTIRIIQKNCMWGVYIPTAFTPNNDRVNDAFRIKIFGNVISFRLKVYNRLGQLVFSTTDAFKVWDGKVKGIDPVSGTYVYECTYHIEGSKPGFQKGTVLLIR